MRALLRGRRPLAADARCGGVRLVAPRVVLRQGVPARTGRQAAASSDGAMDARAADAIAATCLTRARAARGRVPQGPQGIEMRWRAAEARRLDGLLPANGDRPRLTSARHRLDGYGKSAMVLYEAAAVDEAHGVVTRPCHDAGQEAD